LDQLVGESAKAFLSSFRIARYDEEVLSVDIAQVAESFRNAARRFAELDGKPDSRCPTLAILGGCPKAGEIEIRLMTIARNSRRLMGPSPRAGELTLAHR
jgi:hypothetical protein